MILLIFLTVLGLVTGETCPPAEIIHPCACTTVHSQNNRHSVSQTIFKCSSIISSVNLKQIFDNVSPYVGDGVIYDLLSIDKTQISRMEEDTCKHLKFRSIYINDNKNLTYISPQAFGASRNITTVLDIHDNSIKNEAPYERDIFDFFASFKNIFSVGAQNNLISSIPDNAFQNMISLEHLDFGLNNISTIGSKAFSGAPFLKTLSLERNFLSNSGLHKDAFLGISSSAYVAMYCNPMLTHMEKEHFQTLLEQAMITEVGRRYCTEGNAYNPDNFHCDKRANWICDKKEKYRNKLESDCEVGSPYLTIWDYCNATKQ